MLLERSNTASRSPAGMRSSAVLAGVTVDTSIADGAANSVFSLITVTTWVCI